MFGSGGGGGRGRGGGGAPIILLIALGLVVWVAWPGSGWYIVEAEEVGIVRRFGEFQRQDQAGAHLKLPVPMERADKVPVQRVQTIEVGFRTRASGAGVQEIEEESLMLTGDENIVDIDFTVIWRIADAESYLFDIADPEAAVRAAAESAMREVVGGRRLEPIMTSERITVEEEARTLMQSMLDAYDAGVFVRQVTLQAADPPENVIQAFRDVVNAEQDAQSLINEATAYANRVVPTARGEAARVVQQAEAYRARVVASAEGEAARFNLVLDEYLRAPDVTRTRMYLETMERVFGESDKIIMDEAASAGAVPYLPLNELTRPRAGGQQ
jgi:membrane protease subunit HflK